MRRLYQILRNTTVALVFWLLALLFCSVVESKQLDAGSLWYTYFFFVAQLPLYCLVLFGSYALCSIGYHLMVLEDCTEAQAELLQEIKAA